MYINLRVVHAGLLLLSSTQSNSQVLQVPEPLFTPSTQAHLTQPAQAVWPLLDSAFVKSLAPVQDCVLVPDAQVRC